MIGNLVSGCLYNELFSESNEEKCTVFQSIAWSFIVHENTIKNCPTALQAFLFRSLSFCILYFLFRKRKDTSAIPQASVQHLVYVSLVFINALITSI